MKFLNLNLLNKIIEYSFYLLFFLVPLALTGDTSELFEFNKLWLTFVITIVIGASWFSKMAIKKEFRIQRTPLDIPIALFLVSQIASTIFSMDVHVSLWGYYSRFNGGLLSIFSYVFLYYAFVSNFKEINDDKKDFKPTDLLVFLLAIFVFFTGTYIASLIKMAQFNVIPFQMIATAVAAISSFAIFMKVAPSGIIKKSLYAILASAVLVVLWGLPSHFGYDPTCLLFRGTLDVSCWTADFQPRVRVFSTLGQPAWLAAYLAALIPIIFALFINFVHDKNIFQQKLQFFKDKNFLVAAGLFILLSASYLMLLYSISRGAILATWIFMAFLISYYILAYIRPKFAKSKLSMDFKTVLVTILALFAITFVTGQPFSQFDIFTWKGLSSRIMPPAPTQKAPEPATKAAPAQPVTELGGSDSGAIRLLVWKGALDIWKNYPIFGSGVETYAFAYYKFRPAAHNLVSEWKFLYNKAHNEYLNFLATTGTFGIVTYLSVIGLFIFICLKYIFSRLKNPTRKDFLIVSILSGYGTILITNFFGFSVVYINILFFLFPVFVFMLAGLINYDKHFGFSLSKDTKEHVLISRFQKAQIGIIAAVSFYLLFVLANFWMADRYYYLGYNFDRSGDYQTAYSYLQLAVNKRPSEPVFRDEFALNNAILASALMYQNQQQPDEQSTTFAKQLLENSVAQSNRLIVENANNIVFWKTRVRIFYTLSQVDPSYLPQTLTAVKKTAELAPTDADVSYNLGVLYGENGDIKKGVEVLEQTIKLKPDYSNAYYALGIFYHQLALDENGKVVNKEYAQKAIDYMEYLIKTFGPSEQAQSALDLWSKEL